MAGISPDTPCVENPADDASNHHEVVICGAGIVGLTTALALHKHAGLRPVLYEQAESFNAGVGAAIGMYPNGLRVLRDIDPGLVSAIREAGCPYEYRRWMRHDGTEVAVASETALDRRDDGLHSIGIRRFKLQEILWNAAREAGITVHFGRRTEAVRVRPGDSLCELTFADGAKVTCDVLLGADGVRSQVRESVVKAAKKPPKLKYTGTTCLFGLASWPRPERGLCLPASSTSKCHACFFPVSDQEQCFQFHMPVEMEDTHDARWGVMGKDEGVAECAELASRLRQEGWEEQFLQPLEKVTHVVRFGFSLLEPDLPNYVFGPIVLLGDAAHPPVPYLGQGCQLGLEDAGTLALFMSRLCISPDGSLNKVDFSKASRAYETMRKRRAALVMKNSVAAGKDQQRRATNRPYNFAREAAIKHQVSRHGTLPILKLSVTYDYKEHVENMLLQTKMLQAPKMFSFPQPPLYHTMDMYHIPTLLGPGADIEQEPRPVRRLSKAMSKISEFSRESSSALLDLVDGDEQGRKQKKKNKKKKKKREEGGSSRLQRLLPFLR
jgi:2-polyprenyl-6-methoxyphenol hydroxylase-like FAD-dependent oxidoreductase